MSSDFDRRLRAGRGALPEPDAEATERAREGALAALAARRPHRIRIAVLVGTAIVVAAGLGVGIGSVVAPSGEAAKRPVGMGFLPEPGWFTFQTGGEMSATFQTIAVAANVPLKREDVVAGAADPSGLPYATLLELPPTGIVLVASFTRRTDMNPEHRSEFPPRSLPLRLADGSSHVQYGTQIRADEPLGQIQLRAAVNERDVDVTAYFGTARPTRALLAEAQRQLAGLVVDPGRSAATTTTTIAVAPSVIDRTLDCPTALVGGIYAVEPRAHAGIRVGAGWKALPFAAAGTGNAGGRVNDPSLLDNSLAWATAGRPSSTTTMDVDWRASPVRSSGTVALNATTCKRSAARVPLVPIGLAGGVIGPLGEEMFCISPRRVLVRVRATVEPPARLSAARGFLRTQATVRDARLAVRTLTGKPLMYADVADSGKARLFTAKSCEES